MLILSLVIAGGSIEASSAANPPQHHSVLHQSSTKRHEDRVEQQRSAEVAVRRFLATFENLDWEAFRSFLAQDVTTFFPRPEPPHRYEGRAAVEAVFRDVFDAIKADSNTQAPPFHRIETVGLRVDVPADDLAVATFMIGKNSHNMDRRTLILRRDLTGWRIIHLHASSAGL